MWPKTFDARLSGWQRLRRDVQALEKNLCLDTVNRWWFQTPWTGYHLHWDDRAQWPDPWQLLEENVFCSVARGLGIMYTLSLLSRSDIQDAEFVSTKNDNLVLIDGGKYVLNWDCNTIVNINPEETKLYHRITLSDINQLIP